jgi:hypothetical protein
VQGEARLGQLLLDRRILTPEERRDVTVLAVHPCATANGERRDADPKKGLPRI